MPELLLELFSEEIPARMQAKAAEDLRALVTGALVEAGLTYEGAQSHAGPRRLVLAVEGLSAKAADDVENRKGPSVGAPQPAIEGFLRSTGLKFEQLEIHNLKKGPTYVAPISKPGRAATDIVAEVVPEAIRAFPWPKSMRWGSGTLRWIRPLQSILCTFDGEVVPFAVDGIASGNLTRGHRFMGPAGAIAVKRFEDYALKLRQAFVMIDAAERAETIRTEARNLAFAQGLEPIEDEALLSETAGLAEWPVVLMGSFDEKFLHLPAEVIAATIRNNQKCFVLREADASRPASRAPQHEGPGAAAGPYPEVPPQAASKGEGRLTSKYLVVANLVASDGGKEIVAGNNKVIAARLADARFFWDHDRRTPLRDLVPKLDAITFHAKLGSQGERVERIEALVGEIAQKIGADVEKARLAARLCKADLVTGMVGEFPELQGLMGRYYALDQGIDPEVSDAIRDHYKPQGPADLLPVSKVGQAVALADKLDTLVGFWAIDEKPTGSKDPYALRRAALGVIRVILGGDLRVKLSGGIIRHKITKFVMRDVAREQGFFGKFDDIHKAIDITKYDSDLWQELYRKELGPISNRVEEIVPKKILSVETDLLAFFADRLKVYLREQGARYDLIDAVFALGGQDDLLLIVKRVEALSKFLGSDDGEHLLTGVKRAINILRIEEKRDGRSYGGDVRPDLLIKGEEKALHSAITIGVGQARMAVHAEDFEAAMRAIARLRAPVDSFFDHVTVNDRDATFRENRLKLLNRIRAATLEVADFSKIEG